MPVTGCYGFSAENFHIFYFQKRIVSEEIRYTVWFVNDASTGDLLKTHHSQLLAKKVKINNTSIPHLFLVIVGLEILMIWYFSCKFHAASFTTVHLIMYHWSLAHLYASVLSGLAFAKVSCCHILKNFIKQA